MPLAAGTRPGVFESRVPSELWRLLGRDTVVQASVAFLGLELLAFALPLPVDPDWLWPYSMLLAIVGTIAVLQIRLRRASSTRERQLWRYLRLAFGFWGGDVYFFTETTPLSGVSKVTRLDYDGNEGGGLSVYNPNTGIHIPGAGVSTCASYTPQG